MSEGKQLLITSSKAHYCTASVVSHTAPKVTRTVLQHAPSSVYPVYSSVLMQAEAPEAGHYISHAGWAEVQHLL